MSKFKDVIADVTELYDAGANVQEIVSQLQLDIEIVEQALCYIDEERYQADMARNPWQGLIA